MSHIQFHAPIAWGHQTAAITPEELVNALRAQTDVALRDYAVLPDGPEPCLDKSEYYRVSVTIPLPSILFDQLMNGRTGYRAHYAVGIETGESFNQNLVDAVAPLIVSSESLYNKHFSSVMCERSLLGRFSKFWFPKDLTDPSAQSQLLKYEEELGVTRWIEYWRGRPKPRKGLLAPQLESPSILLNGTFVNEAGEGYEQKPGRSKQIVDTGWT